MATETDGYSLLYTAYGALAERPEPPTHEASRTELGVGCWTRALVALG